MQTMALSIRTILLLTIGTLTLLIVFFSLWQTNQEWHRLTRIQSLNKAAILGDALFEVSKKLSVERDVTYALLHGQEEREDNGNLTEDLTERRKETDTALLDVLSTVQQYDFPDLEDLQEQSQISFAALKDLRAKIDQALPLTAQKRDSALPEQWFEETSTFVLQTQDLWIAFIQHYFDIDPYVTRHMRFKHFLSVIMEYAGRERSLISRLIIKNADATPDQQAQLLRWQGTLDLAWRMADKLAEQGRLYPTIAPYFREAKSHQATIFDMVRTLFFLPGQRHGASYPISADFWLEISTQANDSMTALKDAALQESSRYVIRLEEDAWQRIALRIILLVLALVLCAFSFRIIIYRVLNPIHAIVDALVDTSHGREVSINTSMAAHDDEIGKLVQVLHVFQRHTEQIRRNALQLRHYTKALERSNKELDDFAYIASHDLKEPLRGIHNHSRFLLEDNEETLDQESSDRLHRLVYLSQRMERLVNDLLYFSRLDRQDMAICETDMNTVIHDIEGTLELLLKERNAHIIIPQELPAITCDKTRITEVFRNLITNAVKYNDKPEKTIEIGFLPTHPAPEGVAENVFYVKDNGVGIAPEFYGDIFRIFKRLQSSKDAKEEGTGAGLTFVKKIIERHGGVIWLESTPGQGTTFYFTLKEENDDDNQ